MTRLISVKLFKMIQNLSTMLNTVTRQCWFLHMLWIKQSEVSILQEQKHFIKMLKDVGMVAPKFTEIRCTIVKAGDDGMQQ